SARFDRCFELINKTNQFNTTGVRWSVNDAQGLFDRGGYWITLDVKDIYTNYGLTGVIVVDGATIRQFVLSCRVFGMDVEAAGVAIARKHIHNRDHRHCQGLMIETEKNKLSRTIFRDTGFVPDDHGVWHAEGSSEPQFPKHIKVTDLVPERESVA